MKKNFFKKLSFVLALAMIVSVLAPAAGAFAATAPKLNSKTKYLYLGTDKDEYDFNISNKKTGWKYLWSSANENVAEINAKNGVTTATGAGSTKISVVITDKNGEEINELTATVVVRDNIKELTITNVPTDNKLAVGATNDFNRSYVTVAGKKTGTKAKTLWTVTKDGKATTDATIDAMGVFVAKAAGEYVVEARAFQSTAKKTAWVSDPVKYASYVTSNVASVKITVATSMVSAKQTTLKKFDLLFDSVVTKADVEKNLAVAYMAGTAKVKQTVKAVTMSTDGKTATVEMYSDFVKGVTYVVGYTNMKDVQFVSATTDAKDVVEVAVLTTTAEMSKKKTLDIALYNSNKVNIANADLLARVDIDKDSNLVSVVGKDLYMYKVGDAVTITATFHGTYTYDNAGKELNTLVGKGVVTCVEQGKAVVGALSAYTVTTTTNAGNFKDPKHSVFKSENNLKLWVKFAGKDENGDDKTTTNDPTNNFGSGSWTYISSDNNVLIMTGNSIWAANEGTAVVVVKYNDVQVGEVEITVTGAKKVATVALDTNTLSVSNNPNFVDTKSVGLTVKDQLGNTLTSGYSVYVEAKVVSASATALNVNATTEGTANPGATSVTFTPNSSVAEGTYYYTVTVVDTMNNNAKIPTWISVDVKKLDNTATVSYYRIEADKASYDMKVTSTNLNKDVILSLYGYTASGIRVTQENINNLPSLTIKDGKGDVVNSGLTPVNTNSLKLSLVSTTSVSGGTITQVVKKEIGTYLVTATSGTPINAINFNVVDTQPTVSLTVNKTITDKTNLLDAVNDCFDFTLDGSSVELTAANSEITTAFNTSPNAQISKVYIYETLGANTIKHEVDMKNIVIKYAQ